MRGSLRERSPGRLGTPGSRRPGRYITRTIKGTVRAAERALAKLVVEVDEGRSVHTKGRTVATLANAWYESRAPRLVPESDSRHPPLARPHLPAAMGTIPLGRVRTEDVDRFYAERRRQGLSESTVRRHHAMVRSMFSQGVRWGWLGVNPSTNTHRPPIVTATVHPPDPAVVAQLLKYAAGRDPHIYSFLVVAADTGARLGQLCALRWDDFDADTGTDPFTRTLFSTGDIRPLSKTKGRARVVPLGVSTVRTLSVHRTSMKERALSFRVRLAKTIFFFSDDPAGRAPWKVDTFKHRYIKLRREAGRARAPPPSTSTSCATTWPPNSSPPASTPGRWPTGSATRERRQHSTCTRRPSPKWDAPPLTCSNA